MLFGGRVDHLRRFSYRQECEWGVFLHLKQPPTRPHVITNISKSIHFHHKIKPIRASHVSQLSTGRELQLFSSLHPFVSEKRHTQKNSNQTSPVDAVPLNVVFLNCQTCVYNTHTRTHIRGYTVPQSPLSWQKRS